MQNCSVVYTLFFIDLIINQSSIPFMASLTTSWTFVREIFNNTGRSYTRFDDFGSSTVIVLKSPSLILNRTILEASMSCTVQLTYTLRQSIFLEDDECTRTLRLVIYVKHENASDMVFPMTPQFFHLQDTSCRSGFKGCSSLACVPIADIVNASWVDGSFRAVKYRHTTGISQ